MTGGGEKRKNDKRSDCFSTFCQSQIGQEGVLERSGRVKRRAVPLFGMAWRGEGREGGARERFVRQKVAHGVECSEWD